MVSEKSQSCYTNGNAVHLSDDRPFKEDPLPDHPLPTRARETSAKRLVDPPIYIVILTYLSYTILAIFGYVRECLGLQESQSAVENNRPGYAPLYTSFESFVRRNMFRRVKDCWSKPICSVPGAYVRIKERVSHDHNWNFTICDSSFEALNMGSYNYMGFAENEGPCTDAVEKVIRECGVGVCSSRNELGTLEAHRRLEETLAWYSGTEDCLVVGMGFATNSTCIPSFVGPGCLILSDEFNHSSLILGCRLSKATVRVFKHNDMRDLEKKLLHGLRYGCGKFPQGCRVEPWKKILIIVEGIYSMEGTIINLPGVIRLKKKYRAYLYLDEAHSIGCLGPNGRGVIDYFGCDPKDVDLLMGTFTKSFGAAGGFVAGSRRLIHHLRYASHSYTYGTSMAAPVAQQILSATKVIAGLDQPGEGRFRVERLARNVRYFRRKLQRMGFIVYGSDDSPVVPLLIYLPAKVAAFVRSMEARGIATVGVGFPATSLLESRVRFCLSAAHTKDMLDEALRVVDQVGDQLRLKYFKNKQHHSQEEIVY